MGRDKGSIVYIRPWLRPEQEGPEPKLGSGRDQRSFCVDLLESACEAVFVSIRRDQSGHLKPGHRPIFDLESPGLKEECVTGPAAGLLAAHRQFPEAAWLVLACDFPLAGTGEVSRLVRERDVRCDATAYYSDETGIVEPFFTIWEPSALAGFHKSKSESPRHFLKGASIKKIPADSVVFTNCNSTSDQIHLKLKHE
jgi:molybdopterin-guanine dinucleotide biosynthesis protein A